MQQWIVPAEATTPDQLTSEKVAAPEPGPGKVRIRTGAISINARDQMILTGPFGRSPGQTLVPLSDVAGEIDAIGAGVQNWSVGDRVSTAHVPEWIDGPPRAFGIGPGSLDDPGVAAEQLIVDADRLVASPQTLDDFEASTLQVAGVTAWNAVFGDHPVTNGHRVVVLGSGGVALFAAQLALAVGAEVIAAVRTNDDDSRWRSLGILDVVSTQEPGWGTRIRERTGGATKVVNSVGSNVLDESLAALAPGGEVAFLGLKDTAPPPLDVLTLISKQVSIRGVAVGSLAMHRALADFIDEHGLHPVIGLHVPFADLPNAYTASAAPGVFGKVVIDVA